MASIIREIRADIEAIESDTALYEEMNFSDRAEALDSLEFDVIERIESLRLTDGRWEALGALKQSAEMVRGRLSRVDEGLFQRLREYIASGHYTSAELRQRIIGCAGGGSSRGSAGREGYDSLDALVSGFLLTEVALGGIRQREPEMVFYQPTPARIVLEMAEKADVRQDDVFSDGTIFFLYTPFEGRMLQQVLERLKLESRKRNIHLYSYGPCTPQVARQKWLERVDQNTNHVNRIAVFRTPEREN